MPIDTSVYYQMILPKTVTINFIEKIRRVVKNVTGIDPYASNGYRQGEFVKSRQFFLYFVRVNTMMSLNAVGLLVNKDHATVLHAEKCVKKYKEIEPAYRMMFDEIEKRIEKLKTK
jgi:chromosomal replication initiation ATPase DnaA